MEQAALGVPTILAKVNPLISLLDEDNKRIELSALDLSALAEMGAGPIALNGTVFSQIGNDPVPSELVIQSLQLVNGGLDGISTFRTTLETDADGTFGTLGNIHLIPGSYAVIASPNGAQSYAVTRNEIILTPSDMGGKSVFVKAKRDLLGTALTPLDNPAYQVQIALSPATSSKTSFISSLLDTSAQPAAASAFTDDAGRFQMAVDPGVYNLTVQPVASSDLPWAVLSRLSISDVDNQPLPALTVALSNPVVFRGTVRAPSDVAIGNAKIRAFVRPQALDEMDNPPVIQIGETTADADGRYELRLPASVVASVSQ
jgi:hypothetical protein